MDINEEIELAREKTKSLEGFSDDIIEEIHRTFLTDRDGVIYNGISNTLLHYFNNNQTFLPNEEELAMILGRN